VAAGAGGGLTSTWTRGGVATGVGAAMGVATGVGGMGFVIPPTTLGLTGARGATIALTLLTLSMKLVIFTKSLRLVLGLSASSFL